MRERTRVFLDNSWFMSTKIDSRFNVDAIESAPPRDNVNADGIKAEYNKL